MTARTPPRLYCLRLRRRWCHSNNDSESDLVCAGIEAPSVSDARVDDHDEGYDQDEGCTKGTRGTCPTAPRLNRDAVTQLTSAPLVAVVGATGNQGGSVIKALAESDKPYRVWAFTRDPTKPASLELVKLGVEIVVVSLVVENKAAVYKAFLGADVAFLVTNFWEHFNMEKEIEEGKLLIDAVKAGGVSRIVWPGLQSISVDSAGKYTHVWLYDNKALVTAYARQSGVPFVDLQTGFYGTNFLEPLFAPVKQQDGSYPFPFHNDTSVVTRCSIRPPAEIILKALGEPPLHPIVESLLNTLAEPLLDATAKPSLAVSSEDSVPERVM
ncbi:hypothetical protein C8R44DRAFT_988537 [Mycena epipterygia]|nr:hypothetical protein C8R44DRAFT_988537 [Mycena epipterygia]